MYVTILPSLLGIDTVVVECLVCQVISKDQVVQRSCDFVGRTTTKQVTIPPTLEAMGITVLVYYEYQLNYKSFIYF